jgi:hypothetical protein
MLLLFPAADTIYGKDAPVNWPNGEVITDHNGLHKPPCWSSQSMGREAHNIWIDVDLVGTKTILPSRWESWMHGSPTGCSFGIGF